MTMMIQNKQPHFGALYRSVSSERKGDKKLAVADVTGGMTTIAAIPFLPQLPVLAILTLGTSFITHGIHRLFFAKPSQEKKEGIDTSRIKESVIDSAAVGVSAEMAYNHPQSAPAFLASAGIMSSVALHELYEGLKGKPSAQVPKK